MTNPTAPSLLMQTSRVSRRTVSSRMAFKSRGPTTWYCASSGLGRGRLDSRPAKPTRIVRWFTFRSVPWPGLPPALSPSSCL